MPKHSWWPEAKAESFKSVLFAVMFDETKERPSVHDSLKGHSLFGESQAESEESLKHQRPEAGVGGHDVGFVQALADWIIKHRSNVRDSQQSRTPLDTLTTR